MSVPTDIQKLRWLKPEPLSTEEKRCVDKLKQGEFEIGFERVNNILDEAKEIFTRSCRAALGSAGDLMTCIFTAKGDLANASCGTYLHAVIQPTLIKFILEHYQENPGLRDGDIWFTNDALYGGIHNPDEVVIMPIFHDGELIGWAGAAVHTAETGAVEPGGMAVSATSRFMEGMNFPPLKVGEDFKLREDFMELLTAFGIRAPQMLIVDLKARVIAADRIRVRMMKVADEKGVDYVKGILAKMIVTAEEGARRKIRSYPDGKYRCVNFMDGVGYETGLFRLSHMTLEKKADHITLDFTGTGPEQPYSYNAHVTAAVGHISNFIYEYIFHDLPISSASFAPIDFIFPKGTVLNPDDKAATSCSVEGAIGLMCGLHNCFGKMMMTGGENWKQVSASQGNLGSGWGIAGISQWRLPFADEMPYSLNTEGQGGRATMDGINAFGFAWCVFGRAPNVEDIENEFPMIILLSDHWKDSCGHGKYRGGVGTVQVCVTHHMPALVHFAYSGNSRFQPQQPLFGGYLPPTEPGLSVIDSDVMQKMASGDSDLTLEFRDLVDKRSIKGQWVFKYCARTANQFKKGDILTFAFSVGGAGYGDSLDRDPELVMQDLRGEFISEWAAENIYKVAYDKERLRVNQEETNKMRHKEKEDRLSRGKPYASFEKEWLKQKPDEEILKFYGSWPDAKVVNPIQRF